VHDIASPFDLPPIVQQRLQLDDPECLAWVERVMTLLAARMPPEQALWWWVRNHIALRRSPAYFLSEEWQPDDALARFVEGYAKQG
jgi:hypothetical protein